MQGEGGVEKRYDPPYTTVEMNVERFTRIMEIYSWVNESFQRRKSPDRDIMEFDSKVGRMSVNPRKGEVAQTGN